MLRVVRQSRPCPDVTRLTWFKTHPFAIPTRTRFFLLRLARQVAERTPGNVTAIVAAAVWAGGGSW